MADEKEQDTLLTIMHGIEAMDYKLSLVLRVAILALAASITAAVLAFLLAVRLTT